MKTLSLLLLCMFALAACEEQGPAEKAGERIDEAADEVQDKMEEGADKVEDKVEEIGDEIEEKTD